MVTVPAGVLGPPQFNAVSTPAQHLAIPAEDVKLMDPDSLVGSLNLTWLLYDGGMRRGIASRQGLVDMMKQEARRTDLEIADSVKRSITGRCWPGSFIRGR